MRRDLCVSKILNVYQNDTLTWKRNEPRERNRNGLVLFTDGEIEYFFPNQSIVASAGSVMLFPSNVPYHGVALTQRVAYCVLDFQTLSENDICDFGAPCIVKLKNVDVLMLDDFGAELNSSFIRDEFLGPILQYRMTAGLPVFMTSNYDIKSLLAHLSETRDENNQLKASRIIERIAYMMKVVKLDDINYRK